LKKLPLLMVSAVFALVISTVHAGDLVRLVRSKLSAGDLSSGIAAAEDYRMGTGVDEEYLDAVGWLARGAEMLKRPEIAALYVEELHREIPVEKKEHLTPYGAAIEVDARLIAAREGYVPPFAHQQEHQHAVARGTDSTAHRHVGFHRGSAGVARIAEGEAGAAVFLGELVR
jgi:hypothetical protein